MTRGEACAFYVAVVGLLAAGVFMEDFFSVFVGLVLAGVARLEYRGSPPGPQDEGPWWPWHDQ